MVSIIKTEYIKNKEDGKSIIVGQFACLSTDTKPTEWNKQEIGNGSIMLEIDTQKLSIYDAQNKEWKGQ